ncbi:MAG: YdcF family protein [Myxococcales bacterium]|nr:YdcF family protein [Myxococcales bacterium]
MIDRLARLLEGPLVVKEPFAALDAIVVLGSPLGPHDSLTDVLAERVRAAAALYHAGGAPRVITTGGTTRGASRAEADVLAEALRAAGVPAASILVERAALTTADNARLTAALLPSRARVWLVTQPFHGRRAARLFRAAGLVPRIWHIADSLEYADRPRAVRWLVREYAAWAKLLVRG